MSYARLDLGGIEGLAYRTQRRLGVALSLPIERIVRVLRAEHATRRDAASPASAPRDPGADPAELKSRIAAIEWYHTLDLGGGVVTPGAFDHRPLLARYNLPCDLSGKRVLDCATFDGFWAFEFERRGAASVTALDVERIGDVDIAPRRRTAMSAAALGVEVGRGFAIAREALGSRVERVVCNLYELSPERLGRFDVVHCGDVLLHLKDPILALENIRSVTGEYALFSDIYWPDLERFDEVEALEYHGGEGENAWWKASRSALRLMILDAGFRSVEILSDAVLREKGYRSRMSHIVFRAFP